MHFAFERAVKEPLCIYTFYLLTSFSATVIPCASFKLQDGSTALMFACENRNIEIVKRLLAVPGCNAGVEDNVSIFLPLPGTIVMQLSYNAVNLFRIEKLH